MNNCERTLIIGAFLALISFFMPWHAYTEYVNVGGVVQTQVSGTASGYHLAGGWGVLIASMVLVVLVLYRKAEIDWTRFFVAQVFLIAVIIAIFIINGLAPVFSTQSTIYPHLGLASLLSGWVMMIIGIKQGLRYCQF